MTQYLKFEVKTVNVLLLFYSVLLLVTSILMLSIALNNSPAQATANVCGQFRCAGSNTVYEGDCDYRVRTDSSSCTFRAESICGVGNAILLDAGDTRRWCESEGIIDPIGDQGTKGPGDICSLGQCQTGLVCTPDPSNTAISRCYSDGITDKDARCNAPGRTGGRCNRIISFHCQNLVNGICQDNPVYRLDLNHVNGCGQVDEVCDGGGGMENQLCGDAIIYDENCGEVEIPEQKTCNDDCTGTGQGNCVQGYQCIGTESGNKCRLSTNPTSETCSPPEAPKACNDICVGSGRGNCDSRYACMNIDGFNRCRLAANPSSATCSNIVDSANFSIDKSIIGPTRYFVGDIINFQVRVTNTGNTTFTNLSFRDQFEANLIRYTSGSVSKYSSTGQVLTSISDISTIATFSNGRFNIANLASTTLGVLTPGQYYQFSLRYVVNSPSGAMNTCNIAFAQPSGLPERSDDACLDTRNRDTDI